MTHTQLEHTFNNIQAIVNLMLLRPDHPVHHPDFPWLWFSAAMSLSLACISFVFSLVQLQIEELR